MPVDAIYTCFLGFNCNEIVIKMNQFAHEIGMTNTRKKLWRGKAAVTNGNLFLVV